MLQSINSALPPGMGIDPNGRQLRIAKGRRRLSFPVASMRSGTAAEAGRLVARRPRGLAIAPRLTRGAREILARAGWGWADGSGNMYLDRDGILISIERPDNRAARAAPGPIPPQGERIVRLLLDTFPEPISVSELASRTHLDRGYTSRILSGLVAAGTVVRRGSRGPAAVRDPVELFEVWSRTPQRATVSSWFLPGGTAKVVRELQRVLKGSWALTGPFAATLLVPFASVDRIHAYVISAGLPRSLASLQAQRTDEGANLVLLEPRDDGVIKVGTRLVEGLRVCSPAQVYRDALERGRGREREAAEALRRSLLRW